MLFPRTAARPALSALLVGVVLLAGASLVGCSASPGAAQQSSSQPPLGYRSLPSFLPTNAPVDQVLAASPGHPQLAVQGVAVRVETPTGQVLATVTGPHVPPFVAPPPPQVTATFDVALTQVSGTVPVRLDDFTITDQLGRTFHPTLVLHETPPPASLKAGQHITFQVNAVMPTGEGRFYWAPTRAIPFVGWDFIVEND